MLNMLVSDYDQTFYLSDNDIELNKIYVKKLRENNNIFIIATGRSYLDLNNKVEMYNLNYDYAILNHGATIINNKNEIIKNISIDNDIVIELKKCLKLEKSISSFCCSCLESRVNFLHKDLTKINVKYKTKKQAKSIARNINEHFSKYVNAYYVTTNSVEIISAETNKAQAIYLIMKKNNIDKNNVYTVGDGYSDIEMIKEFNGYKMKNGIEELKQYSVEEVNSVHELIIKIMKLQNI